MAFQVVADGKVIGTTFLEGEDLTMAIVFGALAPTPAYLSVRSVFLIFRDAVNRDSARLSEYYLALERLQLQLLSDNGALVPTTWIHITDLLDDLNTTTPELLEVECGLQDVAAFSR